VTVVLFAYGSLVSPASLAGTVGAAVTHGPVPGSLRGRRREWNVGSDSRSHPERRLHDRDGRPFGGTLAVLGLVEDASASVNGALYRLPTAAVELLAVRERNYVTVDVTDAAAPDADGLLLDADRVVTFTPRAEALDRLLEARAAATAAVRLAYALDVARAFARLGAGELAQFTATTTPHDLAVRDLAVSWSQTDPASLSKGPQAPRDR
jgi:cation transport regulator ChaC